MDAQCQALTHAGKQCSRHAAAGDRVCKQHAKTAKVAVFTATATEPWVTRGMPAPALDKLRAHVVQKIRRKLRAGPRKDRSGGSIYVYRLVGDSHPDLYKVGQTTGSVERRLASWARKHGSEVKRVAQYVVSQDVAWVERVVHLYLDYCRVYRYPLLNGGGLESVWAATGEPLDPQSPPVSPRSRLVTEKMIEWFAAPFEQVIDPTISQVH
jgi:hypothetical protein